MSRTDCRRTENRFTVRNVITFKRRSSPPFHEKSVQVFETVLEYLASDGASEAVDP